MKLDTLNYIVKLTAQHLEEEANKNHIFKEKLLGNLVEVPVLENSNSISILNDNASAFSLNDPTKISFKRVKTKSYLVRIAILKEDTNEDTLEDAMHELAASLKRNMGLRDDVITYGMTRLSFKIPGREDDYFLLEDSDGKNYELRAWADFAVSELK